MAGEHHPLNLNYGIDRSLLSLTGGDEEVANEMIRAGEAWVQVNHHHNGSLTDWLVAAGQEPTESVLAYWRGLLGETDKALGRVGFFYV